MLVECAVDEVPSQIFIDPSIPKAYPWRQNGNFIRYVLYLLVVRTHKMFGIKNLKIAFLIEI